MPTVSATYDPLDLLTGAAGRAVYGPRLLARQRSAFLKNEDLSLEALLAPHPEHAAFPGTILDLIQAEIAHRQRRGDRVTPDDYKHRFPQLADALEILIDASLENLGISGVRALGQDLDAFARAPVEALRSTTGPDTTPAGETNTVPVPFPGIPGYAILNVLGRGGMGIVYQALHLRLDRVVALKMIAGSVHNPVRQLRFLAEADAVARLQHPNIVQLFEIGEFDSTSFFTLEYCAGGSLATAIQTAPMAPRNAAALVATLADAVAFAHSQNILHRDLKPENILLAADGTPKIADFGLARRLDEQDGLTVTGDIIGTPAYMAPEQADPRGRVIGPLVDVYGLGAILYRLLTGRTPFNGETAVVTLQKVLHEEPASIRSILDTVDRDLESICLRALAKEPRHRYASAALLSEDLHRYLHHETVRARPLSQFMKVVRWANRNRSLAAAMAIITVGLITLTSLSVFVAITTRRNAELQSQARQRDQNRELHSARVQQTLNDAVSRAYSQTNRGQYADAERDLSIARNALADGDFPAEWHVSLDSCHRALHFAAKLETIYTLETDVASGRPADDGFSDQSVADRTYEASFADFGLNVLDGPPDQVANLLRDHPLKQTLATALVRWADDAAAPARQSRLNGIASDLYHDPLAKTFLQALRDNTPDVLRKFKEDELATLPAEFASKNAYLRIQANDNDGAIRILKAALARQPDDFWLNINVGKVLRSQGDAASLSEAVSYLRTAMALKPRSVGARVQLATALNLSGKPEEGLAICKAWQEYGQSSAPIEFVKGRAWQIRKDTSKAIEAYRQAIAIDANYMLAYFNLAILLNARGETDDAMKQYRTCIQLSPRYAPAYVNLGNILLKKDRAEEALPLLQEATKLKPGLTMAHNSLGSALERLNRLEEAAESYRKALMVEPAHVQIQGNLKRIEQKLKDMTPREGANEGQGLDGARTG